MQGTIRRQALIKKGWRMGGPVAVAGLLFAISSAGYFGWALLHRPNLYAVAAYNPGASVARRAEAGPGGAVGQTFAAPAAVRLRGVAVKYAPTPGSEAVPLRASLAADGGPAQVVAGELGQFTQPRPQLLSAGDPHIEEAALLQLPWLIFVFDPPPADAGHYTFTLEAAAAVPLPYEIDSLSYPDGYRLAAGKPVPGDLSFLLLAAALPGQRLAHLLLTEPSLAMVVWLLAGSLLGGLAVQIVQRAGRGRPVLPEQPVLLWLLLAVLFTLPLYYTTRFWGTEDWPEAAAHYAAARHSLAAGQFPLWNPYFCGGFPAWANPQTYWPSPTFLWTLLAGDVLGTKLAVTSYLFLGLIGMTWLSRTAGLQYPSTFIPPLLYMFSGFFAFHISAGHVLWLTMAWVPFLLHFFWRGLREGRAAVLLAAAVFYLLILIEGQLYFFVYLTVLLAGLGAAIWVASPAAGRQRRAVLLAFFFAASASLGAVKLLPTWSFVQQAEAVLDNVPPLPLRLLPALFLATPEDIAGQDLGSGWWETLAYTGVGPLLAAVIGLAASERAGRRVRFFFLAAGLLALGAALAPAAYHPLEYWPLTHQLRNHNRALLVVVLAVALLAGFGCQALRRWLPARAHEVLVLASGLWLFLDFSGVAHGSLERAFREPALHSDPPPTFTMRRSRTDIAYHAVLAGAGAPAYCPPHLRQWGLSTVIPVEGEADYRGEVFSERGTAVRLQAFTPNRLAIAVGTVPPAGDVVHVNQKYEAGWRLADRAAERRQGRIAFPVGATDSGTTLVLFYRPRSFLAGFGISAAAAGVLGIAGVRRWRMGRASS